MTGTPPPPTTVGRLGWLFKIKIHSPHRQSFDPVAWTVGREAGGRTRWAQEPLPITPLQPCWARRGVLPEGMKLFKLSKKGARL